MAIPKNKEELEHAIRDAYDKLREDLESISPEQAQRKELDGHVKGTNMTVSNLVAYLIGWGDLVLKWSHAKENRRPVDFPEKGYKWNELGKLAHKFYADYEVLDYFSLLSKLDDTKTKILELIGRSPNECLYEKSWYKEWTQGRMIQLNTSSPYKNARSRIRKWKKLNRY